MPHPSAEWHTSVSLICSSVRTLSELIPLVLELYTPPGRIVWRILSELIPLVLGLYTPRTMICIRPCSYLGLFIGIPGCEASKALIAFRGGQVGIATVRSYSSCNWCPVGDDRGGWSTSCTRW